MSQAMTDLGIRNPDPKTLEYLNSAEAMWKSLRRTELQTVCKYHGIKYDPKTTTGEKLRQKLMANEIEPPTHLQVQQLREEMRKSDDAKYKQSAPKPKKDNKFEKMNFFELKHYVSELGMDVDKGIKKDDIMAWLEANGYIT